MSSIPTTTKTWILQNHPKGVATFASGDENATFKLVEREIPKLGPNQVLVKTQFLSNDPAQRVGIEGTMPEDRMYAPLVQLGAPMGARGLGEVVDSTTESIPKGTIVQASLPWSEYVVVDAADVMPRNALPNGLSITHYLGALGGPGLTAYYGLVVIGEAKKGQRIVVSGAAGATGSMVVQIAKNIVGASEVIGIAGTDEKCRWVESLGADKCINYRSKTFEQDLIKATDGFVDVYFDNVGGETLDIMLGRLKQGGVSIACGAISNYNAQQPTMLKNYMQIVTMRLSIRGFIVLDYAKHFGEVIAIFIKALQEGKLKISDKSEQVVPTKFEDVPVTWLKLFDGGNTGKLVTKLI